MKLSLWQRCRVELASWIMGGIWTEMCVRGWCPQTIHRQRQEPQARVRNR